MNANARVTRHKTSLCALTLVLAVATLAACADEEGNPAADATNDTSQEDATNLDAEPAPDDAATSAPDDVDASTDAASPGDGDDDVAPTEPTRPHGGVAPTTNVYIAREFIFEREEPTGVSVGFDLDGEVSTPTTPIGCGQRDYVDPDGVPGIDNQFAKLLPLIEAGGGSALPDLVQAAINEGDLLILVMFEGLNGTDDADDVAVTIARADTSPIVGADGTLRAWQTFDLDTSEPITRIEGAVVRDGVLNGGPATVELPIFVFTFRFDVTLHRSLIRVHLDETGPTRIVVGGAVTLENILDIARTPGIQQVIPDTLARIGPNLADISVDGECDAVSTTATLHLTPAYLFED